MLVKGLDINVGIRIGWYEDQKKIGGFALKPNDSVEH